tara:strand:+ start:27492 stop:28226 length:735 start_codon:yes stop_codon:yes gene_type:complete
MNYENVVALVTGGTAGIGRELARQLVMAGATVIVTGRDRVRLDEMAVFSPKIICYRSDFSEAGDVDRLVRNLTQLHPDISLVINNAGVQDEMNLVQHGVDMDVIRREMAINLDAVMAITIGMLSSVEARGGGAIVNISSGLGIAPKAAAPVYCAAKAAMRSFTKAMRYQCEDSGLQVRIVDVIMTLVDTGMTAGRGRRKASPAKVAASVLRGIAAEQNEIWVGKTKLLRVINRISPRLAARIMR